MESSSKDEVMAEEVPLREGVIEEEEEVKLNEVPPEEEKEAPPKEEVNVSVEKEKKKGPRYRFHLLRPPHKWTLAVPDTKLIFVYRIAPEGEPTPAATEFLRSMRMPEPYLGVFLKADETVMHRLRQLRPYVDYGHLVRESIKSLIHCSGASSNTDDDDEDEDYEGPIETFSDNPALVEKEFGDYNIFTIDDIVDEIANLGSHFEDVCDGMIPMYLPSLIGPKRLKKWKEKKCNGKKHSLLRQVLIRQAWRRCREWRTSLVAVEENIIH